MSALLACLAALLQSAGGLLPGIGYLVSPFATLPVGLAALSSLKSGVFTYVIAAGLLVLLQPAELFIFPFTTGLLGLALGYALSRSLRRISTVLAGGTALFSGIMLLLTVIRFPLFGTDTAASVPLFLGLGVFSFLYAWLWAEIILLFHVRLPSSFS